MGYLILGARTSERSVLPFLKFCAHTLNDQKKRVHIFHEIVCLKRKLSKLAIINKV